MNPDERLQYLIGGPVVFAFGYVMLRSGWWIEERFRVHFVGSGSLFPWALILIGVYVFVRGLLGI